MPPSPLLSLSLIRKCQSSLPPQLQIDVVDRLHQNTTSQIKNNTTIQVYFYLQRDFQIALNNPRASPATSLLSPLITEIKSIEATTAPPYRSQVLQSRIRLDSAQKTHQES